MNTPPRTTDTIPRASIQQMLVGLQHLVTAGGRSTYDAVRTTLLSNARRRAPNTRTALWTVARDVLGELEKLKLASVGPLPRKLSDFERLRDSPCELKAEGRELAAQFREKAGKAFDVLLLKWLAEHPYFRSVISRLQKGPLYVPDLTNLGQLGVDSATPRSVPSMASTLIENSTARLQSIGWTADATARFAQGLQRRFREHHHAIESSAGDAKRLIDLVQDNVVIPAFLEAESLPFDAVSFSQILKCAQEFLCAAWTASYPRFTGRVVFSTCEFDAPLNDGPDVGPTQVIHHGVTYATPQFTKALRRAYEEVAGGNAGYANAYTLRAMVCVDLRTPPAVFSRCLEALIAAGSEAEMTLYTELPFEPPPQGEGHIEVGRRRVGRIKIV